MNFYVVCSGADCNFSTRDKEHNVKKCPYCGNDLIRACPECGHYLNYKGQAFCTQCGASIKPSLNEESEKDR